MLFSRESVFDYTYGAGRLLATLPEDPENVVIANWRAGASGGYELFKANVVTGASSRIASGGWRTDEWVVNERGEPIIRSDRDYDREERTILVKSKDGKGFAPLAKISEAKSDDSKIRFWALANEGRSLITTSRRDADTVGVHLYDPYRAEFTQTLFQDDKYDVSGVVYDPNTASAIGVRYVKDFSETVFFEPADQAFQHMLDGEFPDGRPMVTSWTNDRSRAIIFVQYADRAGEYFVFDARRATLEFFALAYGQLGGRRFGRTEKFDYRAADGLLVPGYLTKPINLDGSNLPLIVLPHGGPAGRDSQAFGWWAHFYASRGYAVYQPNFRGSSGYGAAFQKAGYREWGGKMQDDITEGVAKLIGDGTVDKDRICIVGASYGGYAALAGAMLSPDLYACAVGVNGVYDLLDLLDGDGDDESFSGVRIGRRSDDAGALREASPARNAKAIDTPVLLLHGKDDVVVSEMQSRTMNGALERAGKTVTYVSLEGEDHWLSRAETRIRVLEESIRFIDRHIGE